MGKELDEFDKRYDKFQPQMKSHRKTEGLYKVNEINTYFQRCKYAEEDFVEAVLKARGAGIVGTKVLEVMKSDDVKKAQKFYKTKFDDMADAWAALGKLGKESTTIAADLGKLKTDIEKQVGKAKPSPEAAKLIAKVQKHIDDVKDCGAAVGKVPKEQVAYLKDWFGNLEKAFKAIPANALAKVEMPLPKALDADVLAKATKTAAKLGKEIAALCDGSVKLAATEKKQALADLNTAGGLVKELKKLAESLSKEMRDAKVALGTSKRKAAIVAEIEAIVRAFNSADRKLRESLTAIKKVA